MAEQADTLGKWHRYYHWWIVCISAGTAVVVATLGTLATVREGASTSSDRQAILLAPFAFGALGMLLGVAIACLIAPRAFLVGPLGTKWMKLIGTSRTTVARLICAVLALILAGVALFIMLVPTLKARGILPTERHARR